MAKGKRYKPLDQIDPAELVATAVAKLAERKKRKKAKAIQEDTSSLLKQLGIVVTDAACAGESETILRWTKPVFLDEVLAKVRESVEGKFTVQYDEESSDYDKERRVSVFKVIW